MTDANNSSTARILMQATGETCKVTGLSLSTVSTMYIMKYLLTAGCATVEYLPHLFSTVSTIKFNDHFSTQMNSSWGAVFMTSGVLLTGAIIRKAGSILTDSKIIAKMEQFLYRTNKAE